MLRMSATETKLLARVSGETRCPAYGFFRYFALSFYMSQINKDGKLNCLVFWLRHNESMH